MRQALMECADIRNALMDLVYPFRNVCRSQEEHEVQRGKVLETNLPNSYAKLEAALEMSGTPFMGGETPGPSDFHIFGNPAASLAPLCHTIVRHRKRASVSSPMLTLLRL